MRKGPAVASGVNGRNACSDSRNTQLAEAKTKAGSLNLLAESSGGGGYRHWFVDANMWSSPSQSRDGYPGSSHHISIYVRKVGRVGGGWHFTIGKSESCLPGYLFA